MRNLRTFLILFLIFTPLFCQSLRKEFEVDLSSYLLPHRPYLVWIATDSYGNIFVAQKERDIFLKLSPDGKILWKKSVKKEGMWIGFFDVDGAGNPVCVIKSRERLSLPMIWFDGRTGEKLREIDLWKKKVIKGVVQMKILRPENLILFFGIRWEDEYKKYALHLADFDGNIINSFGESLIIDDETMWRGGWINCLDLFSKRVFINSPVASGIVHVFDIMTGRHICDLGDPKFRLYFTINGDLLCAKRDGFEIWKKEGDNYIPSGTKIKVNAPMGITLGFPVGKDETLRRLFFMGGEEQRILRVYTLIF